MVKAMNELQKIVNEYIDYSYELVSWLDQEHGVQIVRSKIDDKLYVCKLRQNYSIDIYRKLKNMRLQGIPQIYELIETEHGLIIIEEYIKGRDLEDIDLYYMNQDELVRYIVYIGRSLLDILMILHQMTPPMIHRDIKPKNVILSDSKVYLIDFDISREYTGDSNKDTFIMGTREYAAPEQYGFTESDGRTDIYGLGATLLYLYNKYIDSSTAESDYLKKVLDKATDFTPDRRYQNVGEMKVALESYKRKPVYNLKKYALPGFRSGKLFHMLIAITYIVFWTLIFSRFEMGNNPFTGFYKQLYNLMAVVYMTVNVIFIPLFTFDYMNIRTRLLKLFHLSGKNKVIKTLSVLLIDIFFVFISFLIYLIFVVIIFGTENFA